MSGEEKQGLSGIMRPAPRRGISGLPREKAAAALRGFVLLTVVLMARFQSPAPEAPLDWLFVVAAAYVLATTFLPALRLPRERLAIFLSIVDIGLITGLVYCTGGVGSEYYILYYLPIVSAAVRLDFRDGVGASALAAACYVFVALLGTPAGEPHPRLLPRALTFGLSSISLAGFFAYLSREARTYQQLSHWYRQANEEKADFVSTASHELRTPLTAILGFSELLSYQEVNPDKQQEYLKIIKAQAERLARLIENMLELSRLEGGRLRLNLAAVSVAEAVSRVLQNPGWQDNNIQVSIPADLPPVRADARRIEQIMKILVDNAVRFSGEGPVEISARAESGPERGVAGRLSEPGEFVHLEIRDHGPGIPPEDLPHIFKMFYCPSNSRGRQGTGLSLAIAKRLTELQKGEIRAESSPGGGAAFTLSLPICEDDINAPQAAKL